jgi:hypothetical protein
VDYISTAFSFIGFFDIVSGNAFSKVGLIVFESTGSFKNACIFWCIVTFIVSMIFYLSFFIWKNSENN